MKRIKKLLTALIISLSLVLVAPVSIMNVPTNVSVEIQAKSQTVYITKTGSKYHKKKCGNGKFSKTTLAKAKKSKLKPCKKCYGK